MGHCECGCGQVVRRRFAHGHNVAGVGPANINWRGGDVGYVALHSWLSRNYPKRGVCEECGHERYTEYALLAEDYSRRREDYAELCKSCHEHMDKGWKPSPLRKTHCKRGHPLEGPEARVYVKRDGARQCLVCRRIRWKALYYGEDE